MQFGGGLKNLPLNSSEYNRAFVLAYIRRFSAEKMSARGLGRGLYRVVSS